MKNSENTSLWKEITKPTESYPELQQDIEADVVIIGGGITGVTAASQLLEAGKKVVLLEAHHLGSGTTGFSTGNLYTVTRPYFQEIQSKFDLETVKLIAQSRKVAIDYIENNIKAKKIECNFGRRPWFLYTNENKKIDFLNKEYDLLKKIDMDVQAVDAIPFKINMKKAISMPNQARFNPMQYVVSMAAFLKKQGLSIFEHSRVISIEEKKDCRVKTKNGQVTAKKVIIATHTPTGVNPIQFYTAPYRSYVVGIHVTQNEYPEGHFWSIESPAFAACTHAVGQEKPNVLLIAGSHHKTGQSSNTLSHYEALENYLKENYDVKDFAYRWSAQHYTSADDIPYIGLESGKKHIYQATGFFADGLVYGTVAGILLADVLLKKDNTWKDTYNSDRFTPVASLNNLMKEGINIMLQYMKDMPSFSREKPKELKVGEAKVLEINGEKCGVYRESQDKLHVVSAVCTHMKCIVNWNTAEKTWDCPCHGSRFSFKGEVLEGPAQLDLASKSVNVE